MSPRLAGARKGNSLLVQAARLAGSSMWRWLGADNLRAVLWAGRPQEDGGGLCADTGESADKDVWDDDAGSTATPGMVAVRRRHPRGNGVDRRLLEAGLQPA